MQIFIIKQVHVKSINMTIKRVTKGIHGTEDIDTFLLQLFKQNYFSVNTVKPL